MKPNFPSILAPALVALFLPGPLDPMARAEDGQPAPPAVGVATPGPSRSEFQARRRILMEKIKEAEAGASAMRAAIRAASGGASVRPTGPAGVVVAMVGAGEPGDDAKFRQDNDFAYLTGVDVPDAALLLWPETGEEALYLPPRDLGRERWDGPRPGPGPEGASATGFARVESSEGLLADLFRAVGDPRAGGDPRAASVYLIEPEPKLGASRSARFSRLVREGAPSARLKDVAPRVHEMRKVKSDAEAALIRRAVAVTAGAQAEVVRLLRPGIPEYRLEGAILAAFVGGGASRAGFPSIVGSGPNSTILHYHRNDRTIEDGDLVVVDIGGEYKGYTADITRTYPASGRFSPRQLEVYRLVLDAQSAAATDFQVGVSTIASLTRAANNVFRASPLRARDEDGSIYAMDHFFIHGLGHHLGMDVHDVGDGTRPLGPGEVFTIEPGLYIPSEGFGVRIEDDYRVTKDGLEKLSKDIPVAPDEVERLIVRARGSSLPTPAAPRASPSSGN